MNYAIPVFVLVGFWCTYTLVYAHNVYVNTDLRNVYISIYVYIMCEEQYMYTMYVLYASIQFRQFPMAAADLNVVCAQSLARVQNVCQSKACTAAAAVVLF